MSKPDQQQPSLEQLIEQEALGLEVLHPGGLEITRELAESCRLEEGSKLLDVASGTGESGCFLARHFGCQVIGVDISDLLLQRAKEKAEERQASAEFVRADAHSLPFPASMFDAVISECTTCLLDKEKAIREMMRVTKAGGSVGIHDICWKERTPEDLKRKLEILEGEKPETLAGWSFLFEQAGLRGVETTDKSDVIPTWMKELKRQFGFRGLLRIATKILSRWGVVGFKRIWESEKLFESPYIGYGIIVGKKQ